ncbi:PEP-CTERM sorting domain-containing protein [Massilia sp. CF038]|uniref:PEP-CTERM sorting domain-containing protein n=1 Tax=Massilia sp. CF038 TaxID=1881045 RepID=UPI000914DB33|nr:PEP-CTERM sorting domain-containing protein [Massilia sp. CF038]SHG40694.1 PEP-CTERM protein-sorting domain-containing protein [Massilia sp. CF038]
MKSIALKASVCALFLLAGSAHAGSIGTATINDVTLSGAPSDALSYANGINPQSQGKNGGSTGFAKDFASYGSGDWARLAAFDSKADDGTSISTTKLGSSLTFTFDKTNGRNGSWTLTNTDLLHAVDLDLVFAIHTGGGSGAWLFDDQQIGAGQTLNGSWALNLLNNGRQYSGYSNLTIFGRDFNVIPPTDTKVPEPGTPASIVLGLGLLGVMMRRRKSK